MYLTHAPGEEMPYFSRNNSSARYRQGEKKVAHAHDNLEFW